MRIKNVREYFLNNFIMVLQEQIDQMVLSHKGVIDNPDRSAMIQAVIDQHEAFVTPTGALATWNPTNATGRSPDDTYIVEHAESAHTVDWTSPNNHRMSPAVFDQLLAKALSTLATQERLYIVDRTIGARSSYALNTRVLTNRALTALFADTMFRPVGTGSTEIELSGQGCTVVVVPTNSIDLSEFSQSLRMIKDKVSPIVITMDMDRRVCLVIGTAYAGTVKKMLFTVMNYLLPEKGILPLHASAMESEDGRVTVLLGLSGTGKTTLSSDPRRLIIGDDELGWSSVGVANFEYGCYAKLVGLDKTREPAIYNAVFTQRPVLENGCIIENAMMYPDGTFDLNDQRLTENSRTAYPLSFLPKVKEGAIGDHPKTIIFLTADAFGVLPPIARLTPTQAVLWFLMGYTSKLAGTEVGVKEPATTFSRFFGQPFMPRNPQDYTKLMSEYLERYKTPVFLVNTGWSGGPYGIGKRMDINLTRAIVDAAVAGSLEEVQCEEDKRFHVMVPTSCPGVDSMVLQPRQTWSNPQAFDETADALAKKFWQYFEKNFGTSITDPAIVQCCPGK